MKEMRDVFEFGAHTHNMHNIERFRALLTVKSIEEIKEDALKCREILGDNPYFCFPYGQFNENSIKAIRQAGYRMAFSTNPGYVYHGDDLMRTKRFFIFRNMPFEAFKYILSGCK